MQGARRELTRSIKPLFLAAVAAAAMLAVVIPALAVAQPPDPPARAWVLVDGRDGDVLAAQAAGRRVPIASTTKLMTAYVARRDLRLAERVAAPGYRAAPGESLLGLEEGERLRVRDLLAGLLLASGNDAAVALAEASAGSVAEFVEEMNATARDLGLDGTTFSNPIGLDEPGNRSTAADLAALAIELRHDGFFRRLFDRPRVRLRSGSRTRQVVNRNDLVHSVPWVDGVKTGQTAAAGSVLVGSGSRNGVSLVSVVLGAPAEDARDAATLELLRYGFSLYRRHAVVSKGEPVAEAGIRHRGETLRLLAGRAVEVFVRDDQDVATEVIAPRQVQGAVERGDRLGRVVVTVDGEPSGGAPLTAARDVAAATVLERLGEALPRPPLLLLLAVAVATGLALRLARRHRSRRDNLSGGES